MTLLWRALIGIAAGLLLASPALAQPAPASPGGQHDSSQHASSQHDSKGIPLPTYAPPTRGSPNARIAGATRGMRPATHSAKGSSGP